MEKEKPKASLGWRLQLIGGGAIALLSRREVFPINILSCYILLGKDYRNAWRVFNREPKKRVCCGWLKLRKRFGDLKNGVMGFRWVC